MRMNLSETLKHIKKLEQEAGELRDEFRENLSYSYFSEDGKNAERKLKNPERIIEDIIEADREIRRVKCLLHNANGMIRNEKGNTVSELIIQLAQMNKVRDLMRYVSFTASKVSQSTSGYGAIETTVLNYDVGRMRELKRDIEDHIRRIQLEIDSTNIEIEIDI